MKKIIFVLVVLTLLCTSCSFDRTGFEGSTWTVYTYFMGEEMSPLDYAEKHQEPSVKTISNIEFKDGKAEITEKTYSNQDGLELNDTTVDKGGAVSDVKEEPCRLEGDDLIIGNSKYKYDKDTDTLTTNIDDATVIYIRDYGVKGKTFYLNEAYKDGELIYESEGDDDTRKAYADQVEGLNKITQYSFGRTDGEGFVALGGVKEEPNTFDFDTQMKEGENRTEVVMEYSDETENAVYDRLTETLMVEHDGVRRIFEPTGYTPLFEKGKM